MYHYVCIHSDNSKTCIIVYVYIVTKAKKNICVFPISMFMGLQNRVGRSGFFFFLQYFDLKTSELLSKWSDLHNFFIYDPQ